MKIGQPTAGVQEQAAAAPAAGSTRTAQDQQAAGRPNTAPDSSAQVELSSTAASLITAARGAPAEIDTAKIERIAQAIADGSYKINAEAIADKLIANAQEVLGSVKR